ncbi:MAG: FAD-dependent monooxygenase, partial [Bauldia litoralis]
ALHDVPVLVFEAGEDLAVDLRASTFHPPTLDMLDFFDGVNAELHEQGLVADTWQFRDRKTGPVVTWDMSLLAGDTNHPYRLQAEQWKLTRALLKRLDRMPNADIRFAHRVTDVSQTGDTVTFTAETPDGTEQFDGRWGIGAEGANSAVRRALGIAYEGLTFPELFLTISTTFEFRDHWPDLTLVNYVTDPDEWLVLLRVVDAWRVLFPTKSDEDKDVALSDERIQARLQSVVPSDTPYEVVHKTHYHVHQRVAEKYRSGRVLLAGDSAHINNPLGGMGMNGGIQDAFSLAEKLVGVWRGEADDAILDKYERQRRAMALDFVQQSTIRNRELIWEKDQAMRAKRHEELRRIADDPEKARAFLLRSSMISGLRESEAID